MFLFMAIAIFTSETFVENFQPISLLLHIHTVVYTSLHYALVCVCEREIVRAYFMFLCNLQNFAITNRILNECA